MKKYILLLAFLFIGCTKKIEVNLVEERIIKVGDTVYVSEFIDDDRITVYDYSIDTNRIGDFIVDYSYKYKNKNYNDQFNISIIDDVEPTIIMSNIITINKDTEVNLKDYVVYGDNYDRNPEFKIIGDYDISQIGSYNLTLEVTDSSNNKIEFPFVLRVIEPVPYGGTTYSKPKIKFDDILQKYENENTKVGIDVSKWQGEIDWKKVKESGASFAFIRIGVQNGFDGDIILDPYFKQNIENALLNDVEVGVYFFSYAQTKMEAKRQALWVLNQLKEYKITLPVVFDWENWKYFNDLNLSFIDLNEIASTFMKEVESKSYSASLYGSKYYLENIWDTDDKIIWLAHYISETNYQNYHIWQLTDSGRINGIQGDVDIDIMVK